MTYQEKLKDPRWEKKRLQILNRDKFTCIHCGDTENTLHVHHKSYHDNPWDAPDHELKTLCEDCHSIQHSNLSRLERMLYDRIVSTNHQIRYWTNLFLEDYKRAKEFAALEEEFIKDEEFINKLKKIGLIKEGQLNDPIPNFENLIEFPNIHYSADKIFRMLVLAEIDNRNNA